MAKEIVAHIKLQIPAGQANPAPPVALLADIVGMWRQKNLGDGLVLAIDGCAPIAVREDSPTSTTVSGTLAGVTRWAAGRGAIGVTIEGDLEQPPRWL